MLVRSSRGMGRVTAETGDHRLLSYSVVVIAVAAAVAAAACGTPVPPTPPDPKALPTVEAQAATLEERDTAGVLLWRVSAARARERAGEVACESVAFVVPGGGVSAAGGIRHHLPALGFTATSPVGSVARPETGPSAVVVLDSGYVIHFENGWVVSGQRLRWDGELIRTAGSVLIERPGMRMMGRDGVIHPRGPRVVMRAVRGTIEGVAL